MSENTIETQEIKTQKICRIKDLWYIFIPKQIMRMLIKNGYDYGDRVIWTNTRIENGNVVAEVIFTKRNR
ncbi:MAG: hypothetical protein QW215_00135 [Ignisphaera sp.]